MKVYQFLDGVPSYTELLRENRLGDVDCSGDKKIWRIVTPRPLHKNGKPCFIMLASTSWNGNMGHGSWFIYFSLFTQH